MVYGANEEWRHLMTLEVELLLVTTSHVLAAFLKYLLVNMSTVIVWFNILLPLISGPPLGSTLPPSSHPHNYNSYIYIHAHHELLLTCVIIFQIPETL